MVKQQNNQPFIGVSTVIMLHLVKLGEALFNLVKRGFPFPKVLSSVCSEAPPKVSFTTMSMSPADRKSICPHRGRNRYECARSYREYGSNILILKYRASSNPQNGIWLIMIHMIPNLKFGELSICTWGRLWSWVEAETTPIDCLLHYHHSKTRDQSHFPICESLFETWWNDSYSKIAKPDTILAAGRGRILSFNIDPNKNAWRRAKDLSSV